MCRRSSQSTALQHGTNLTWSVILVPGKFHFPIPDLCNLCELALKIALHHFPDGIQLQADLFYLVIVGGQCEPAS